jgi:tRNA pseudouridine38-40 synthase
MPTLRARLTAGQAWLAADSLGATRRTSMPRYRLTLAYDGTDFAGWQVQAPELADRTVQGVLETMLQRLARGAVVRVTAAGRTDAGVHALGQVASFDLPHEIPPADLCRALNAMLPPDVRVSDARIAAPGFCARRRVRNKLYRYVLDTGLFQQPARRRAAAFVPVALDEEKVMLAAALFVGTQDFASLASAGGSVETTTRTVIRSVVCFDDLATVPRGRTMTCEVEGDGFLRKMVRSMVGGLIAVGRGVSTCADLERALSARDRRAWPAAPAPACGLTLVRVDYDDEAVYTRRPK